MNILYLCTVPGFMVANDVRCFEALGHHVTVVNTGKSEWHSLETYTEFAKVVNLYASDAGKRDVISSVHTRFFPYSKILLENVPVTRCRLLRHVTDASIDIVFGSYDAAALIETSSMKRLLLKNKLKIPVIFRFLMYPTTLSKSTISLENLYLRRRIEMLDGRIWPTERMLKYATEHLDLQRCRKDLVFPFTPSCYYYPKKRLAKLSRDDGEPHVVFIGSSDFRIPWRNIRWFVEELTKASIHFHMAKVMPEQSAEKLIAGNKYLHYFDFVPMNALSEFMTSFDGCIIVFNYSAISCGDRLKNGIPNRMFWAFASGIPIFVFSPNGELQSCEDYVYANKVGSSFRGIDQLENCLKYRQWMQEACDSVERRSLDLCYEKKLSELDSYLRKIAETSS